MCRKYKPKHDNKRFDRLCKYSFKKNIPLQGESAGKGFNDFMEIVRFSDTGIIEGHHWIGRKNLKDCSMPCIMTIIYCSEIFVFLNLCTVWVLIPKGWSLPFLIYHLPWLTSMTVVLLFRPKKNPTIILAFMPLYWLVATPILSWQRPPFRYWYSHCIYRSVITSKSRVYWLWYYSNLLNFSFLDLYDKFYLGSYAIILGRV